MLPTLLPRLYLGTMTWGWSQASSPCPLPVAVEFLDSFMASPCTSPPYLVDTARIYAGGATEPIVGGVVANFDSKSTSASASASTAVLVGTKCNPAASGGLSPSGIESQIAASLEALQATKVGEFYLHQPDPNADLLDSLRALSALHKAGTISSIGMSNYHSSEVARAFSLCAQHKLVKPSVYQGIYSPLNRLVEADLLPILRENGCSFVAYNPLAAGLLSGKHSGEGDVPSGRFSENQNYLPRFYTDANFAAVDDIRRACAAEGLPMVEATFRWLLAGSALAPTDGVLLGASSVAQLEENLAGCDAARVKGRLPESVQSVMDGVFEKYTADSAFKYWRGFSRDHPGREGMDQGANYEAGKKGEKGSSGSSDSRSRMISEIGSGAGDDDDLGDASTKVVLSRGCDPVMAQKAGAMLPPLLGNAQIESCTSDADFFSKLATKKYDAVFFAPGACRFSAAGAPIPGAVAASKGWTLEEYRAFVREKQGEDVKIVETTEERNIVPLLREALGLKK